MSVVGYKLGAGGRVRVDSLGCWRCAAGSLDDDLTQAQFDVFVFPNALVVAAVDKATLGVRCGVVLSTSVGVGESERKVKDRMR